MVCCGWEAAKKSEIKFDSKRNTKLVDDFFLIAAFDFIASPVAPVLS